MSSRESRMLSRSVRIVSCLALAAALGGCLATHDAYLVTGNPVNPRPVERYRVECQSVPNGLNFIAGDYVTNCQQYQDPEERASLRVRG